MQHDGRFNGAYLVLVALIWDALERIHPLLGDARAAWVTSCIEGRLQWLRLELLQVRASAARCAATHRLSAGQHQRMQTLVAKQLAWLDFDADTPLPVVRLRLAAAQDWLLDEAAEIQSRRRSSSTRSEAVRESAAGPPSSAARSCGVSSSADCGRPVR